MPDRAPSNPENAVHWAIILKAREGKVAELEAALVRFAQRSFDDRGTAGVHIIRPTPGTGSREFLLHRAFQSMEHSRRFYESDVFKQYQKETDEFIEGAAVIRPLHGFEAFFRGEGTPPPRWKMAIVTWMGVFPAVLFWSQLLSPRLRSLHPFAATAIMTMLVVITLTWLVMPRLTNLLRPWLQKRSQHVSLRVPRHEF